VHGSIGRLDSLDSRRLDWLAALEAIHEMLEDGSGVIYAAAFFVDSAKLSQLRSQPVDARCDPVKPWANATAGFESRGRLWILWHTHRVQSFVDVCLERL
jgi:hypothetical protein